MKKSLFVSYLLVLLGMLMPIVPVFPHHHHADGRICMKNDLHHGAHEEESCGHGTHGCHHEQGCNEADCLTTHFYRAGKSQTISLTAPQTATVEPMLLKTGLAGTITLPSHYLPNRPRPYLEALFATDIPRARGLRAPPSVD